MGVNNAALAATRALSSENREELSVARERYPSTTTGARTRRSQTDGGARERRILWALQPDPGLQSHIFYPEQKIRCLAPSEHRVLAVESDHFFCQPSNYSRLLRLPEFNMHS